jgi:cysteine-rich repeat protein
VGDKDGATLASVVRRSARDRVRAAGVVGGLALGSASGCNDIVALDCDAVTDACATTGPNEGESEGSSGAGEGTSAEGSESGATAGSSDVDTSASDSTGPSDTGPPSCGDGIVDGDEECDDGDLVDIDECSNECRRPVCGDGLVQFGEDCDLGMGNHDHGTCKSDCRAAICGDGVILFGVESCDGADLDGYSCETVGYPGGELLCDASCQLDFSMCSLCAGGEPCDAYQLCEDTCESGLPCWNETGQAGTCLPVCMGPENCLPYEGFATECIGDTCVIPCENECPGGLLCQESQFYPGMVCLW